MHQHLSPAEKKRYQELKAKLQNYWKEDTVSSETVLKNFYHFFENNHKQSSYEMLFMNLLDLQCHYQKLFASKDPNLTFQKLFGKNEHTFPFIIPFFNQNFIQNPLGKQVNDQYIQNVIYSLLNDPNTHDRLKDFLSNNSHMSYYFWNITFPNIFGGFVFFEYCQEAETFLSAFQNEPSIYVPGFFSFIKHNYGFRNSFMENFFMEVQKLVSPDHEQLKVGLQQAFKTAARYLSSSQLSLFKKIIAKYPKETEVEFYERIISNSLKFWHYSELFYPNNFLFDSAERCPFLQHLESLENKTEFIQPFFTIIEQMNETYGETHLVDVFVISQDPLLLTFLDILILSKVTQLPNSPVQSYLDKDQVFNPRYILTKGFRCCYFHRNKKIKPPSPTREEPTLEPLDPCIVAQWNKHVERCKLHNEFPLAPVYENIIDIDLSDSVLYAGLAITDYNHNLNEYYETDIKGRLHNLIPFKQYLRAQNALCHMTSLYWASQCLSIGEPDFDITVDNEIYCRFLSNLLKNLPKHFYSSQNKKIKQEFVASLQDNIYHALIQNDQLNSSYRSDKNRAYNLSHCYTEILARITKKSIKEDRDVIIEFKKYYDYLEELCRGEILCTYRFYKTTISITGETHQLNELEHSITNLTKSLVAPDLDNDDFDDSELTEQELEFCNNMNSQGLFEYIFGFIKAIETPQFYKDSTVPLGSIFIGIPVIIKMLDQLFVGPQRNVHPLFGPDLGLTIDKVFTYVCCQLEDENHDLHYHLNIIRGIFAKALETATERESRYRYYREIKTLLQNLKDDFTF